MFGATINYFAVIVAVVVSMLIGYAWYSKSLFGNSWMVLVGKRETDLKSGTSRAMTVAILSSFLTAYVLSHFVDYLGLTTFREGIKLGWWLWLGFVATAAAVDYVFAARPLKLYAIVLSQQAVMLMAMAGLIAAMN